MKKIEDPRQGAVVPGALIAGALFAFVSVMGFLVMPLTTEPLADMYIEPQTGVGKIDETFSVTVMVRGATPVNVFAGEVTFDSTVLSVESIDYNTSIADLWAEKPWYENGAGTINFIGGTTRKGGFFGTGSLITITFRAHGTGDAVVRVRDARILAHDGLGTDVPLGEPIDSLFSVAPDVLDRVTVAKPETTTAVIVVGEEFTITDLNRDGKQTIADVSIFMLNMTSEDVRFDFNRDGQVDTKDLSIIMSAS